MNKVNIIKAIHESRKATKRELEVPKQEMLIQWNSQNIVDTLKDEKNSREILKIAEEKIKYNQKQALKNNNDNKG